VLPFLKWETRGRDGFKTGDLNSRGRSSPLRVLAPSHSLSLMASSNTPQPRRQRVLACGACRSRRTRCDGGRPKCSSCRTRSLDCHYPEVSIFRLRSSRLSNIDNVQVAERTVPEYGHPALIFPLKSTRVGLVFVCACY
jgi:hypothetical protein